MARPRGNPFPEGNKEAHGGARPGAGRKPNWLKEKCQKLFEETKVLDFLAQILRHEEVKPHVDMFGKTHMVKPALADWFEAVDRVKDWGFGKTPLPVRATDEDGEDVGGVIFLPVQSSGKAGTILKPKRGKETK